MKRDEWQKIKARNEVELKKDLGEAREELRKLKFDLGAGKFKNFHLIQEKKKKIARLLTLLNTKNNV